MPKAPIDFNNKTYVVNGQEVVLKQEDLEIGDISTDMDRVASQMAFWGNVHAAAVEEEALADAFYRSWYAKKAVELGGMAEGKKKAEIEATDKFLEIKAAMAKAAGNVIGTKLAFEAFAKKANQLQSKGAQHRSEFGATGMHTPIVPKTKARRAVVEDEDDAPDVRKSAMKGIFGKKKRPK